jgi:hypothetical protein
MPKSLNDYLKDLRTHFLGATKTRELPEDEVDALIDNLPSEQVTDELFKFGEMLLAENEARIGALESKATVVVGYSGAVLAFLVLRAPDWARTSRWELVGLLFAALCAASACTCAFSALIGAKNWDWFSEKQWLAAKPALVSADKLKRHYLKAMHGVKQTNHRITNRKADSIIKAQLLLAATAIVLGVTLAAGALRMAVGGPIPPSESCRIHASDCQSTFALYRNHALGYHYHHQSIHPIDRDLRLVDCRRHQFARPLGS